MKLMCWCVCSFSGDLWFVLFISTLSSLVFLYCHPHPIIRSLHSYLQRVLNYRGLLSPTNQRKRKEVSKHQFWLSNRNVATNSVPDVQKASRQHFTSRCLSVSAACPLECLDISLNSCGVLPWQRWLKCAHLCVTGVWLWLTEAENSFLFYSTSRQDHFFTCNWIWTRAGVKQLHTYRHSCWSTWHVVYNLQYTETLSISSGGKCCKTYSVLSLIFLLHVGLLTSNLQET